MAKEHKNLIWGWVDGLRRETLDRPYELPLPGRVRPIKTISPTCQGCCYTCINGIVHAPALLSILDIQGLPLAASSAIRGLRPSGLHHFAKAFGLHLRGNRSIPLVLGL